MFVFWYPSTVTNIAKINLYNEKQILGLLSLSLGVRKLGVCPPANGLALNQSQSW